LYGDLSVFFFLLFFPNLDYMFAGRRGRRFAPSRVGDRVGQRSSLNFLIYAHPRTTLFPSTGQPAIFLLTLQFIETCLFFPRFCFCLRSFALSHFLSDRDELCSYVPCVFGPFCFLVFRAPTLRRFLFLGPRSISHCFEMGGLVYQCAGITPHHFARRCYLASRPPFRGADTMGDYNFCRDLTVATSFFVDLFLAARPLHE